MATLACQRMTCLRTTAFTSRTFTFSRAAFSTAARPLQQQSIHEQTSRPSIVCLIPPHRFAPSSTPFTASRKASSTPVTTPTSTPPSEELTWNRFFDLRRKRRYINLVASLVTAGASVAFIGPVVAGQDLDTWGAQASGLDPFIVLGIVGIGIGAVGWLCGPSIGSGFFGLWAGRRGWNKAIAEVSAVQ